MTKSPEVHPATIYIPDMSGFSNFVSKAGINYSTKIIPELLKNLIRSNILDLRVAEIQGDAILFYKIGTPPSLEEICQQSKKIFVDFDYMLKVLEHEMDLEKSPIDPADNLGLKIIVHYGRISIADIGGLDKLIGEDVIIAHKLLKNNVDMNDYLLLSEKYLKFQEEDPSKVLTWSKMHNGSCNYEAVGEVKFKYISLKPLERLTPEF